MNAPVTPASSDPRPLALGVARLLMAADAALAVWVLWDAARRLIVAVTAPGLVDFGIGVAWALVAAGIIHNGHRMRRVAWAGLIAQALACLAVVGFAVAGSAAASACLAWDRLGAHFLWIPPLLLAGTVLWMIKSDPRRLAARS